MYCNFVRIHQTLKVTPAMAAGVTFRLWEMGDIVDVLEAWEAKRQHNAVAAWWEALMSASLINDPKHWRERAKEARAMADEMKDQQAKQMMLGIARD
jgi:hypothetical protein